MATLTYYFLDLVGALVRGPIWWYTNGLVLIATARLESVRSLAKSVALGVWVKNLFVPMFGQRDWQSRVISFFMRLFQIFFRGIWVAVWTFVNIALFFVYLVLPIVATLFAMYHVIGPLFVSYG